jgi:hypothetical protein
MPTVAERVGALGEPDPSEPSRRSAVAGVSRYVGRSSQLGVAPQATGGRAGTPVWAWSVPTSRWPMANRQKTLESLTLAASNLHQRHRRPV